MNLHKPSSTVFAFYYIIVINSTRSKISVYIYIYIYIYKEVDGYKISLSVVENVAEKEMNTIKGGGGNFCKIGRS